MNTKVVIAIALLAHAIYLLIFIAAFVGIVVWVFGRKRKARFAKDAQIPFEDGKGCEIRRWMLARCHYDP